MAHVPIPLAAGAPKKQNDGPSFTRALPKSAFSCRQTNRTYCRQPISPRPWTRFRVRNLNIADPTCRLVRYRSSRRPWERVARWILMTRFPRRLRITYWGQRCRTTRVRCIMQNASDARPQADPAARRRSTGWSRVTKIFSSYAGRRVVRIESGPSEVVLDFDPDASPFPKPETPEESCVSRSRPQC